MKENIRRLVKQPMLLLLVVLVMLTLIVFIVYPLFQIFLSSFISNGEIDWQGYKRVFAGGQLTSALTNSLVLAVIVSILSTAIAYFFAYTLAYIKVPFKKLFNGIAILPVISPPFVIALSAILLFGRGGFISETLLGIEGANIYGLHGLILVQTLTYFPVAFLVLAGLLQSISPSLEEASDNLGSTKWQTFKKVTLPLSVPGIGNAFLLVFIQSMADFGNPMTIGGDYNTVAREIYMQAVGSYNMQAGAALAMVLLSATVILYVLQNFWIGKKNYVTVTGKPTGVRKMISQGMFRRVMITICFGLSGTVILFYILVPIGSFIQLWGVNYSFTLDHYNYVFSIGQKAVTDTLRLSIIATPIGGLFAMILAFLIVRKRFAGKKLMEGISMLSMAIPGTVIGISYILAFNQAPLAITGTALIIIAAFIVRAMPVGIRSGITSLQQIDPSIEEAATNLGASGSKTFFSIVLPLIRPAFFSSIVYTFVKSMTAMSAVIFLVSAKYNLITASILAQVESGRIGVASAYCTLLIILMIVAMLILNGLTSLFTGKWKLRKDQQTGAEIASKDSVTT
ncbi:iron ABC transporter permease [Oceanobacillus oncorhynchi subsp. incaldanensis]|uniref:ABC transporter permease n=1 Tax=Oceanobacillus TaxID=182709 RepID=UPI001867D9FE|nr:iron ABC transporter permease [Oceanobacillus oncorhynchi]UUI40645.1 iron ABC transporter permease [Oceanobacillus oncorhynchi]GIO20886.1 iron ABC transporter permease [Oceanobacillus oncorhynchi subsp. incaldanensis]